MSDDTDVAIMDATGYIMATATERAIWAASRLAALEEAAKVCEELAFDSELALAMVNDDGSPFFNKKDVELGIAACNNCAADIRELIKR